MVKTSFILRKKILTNVAACKQCYIKFLVDMTKLLAPILVHTAEEVWSHTPHVKEERSFS